MTTLEEVKTAITKLTPDEYSEFREWFSDQIERLLKEKPGN